jgi:dicarboxylate transporter 10
MQTSTNGASNLAVIVKKTLSQSGPKGLFVGLSASLLRQMSYSLVRLGSYEHLKATLSKGAQDIRFGISFGTDIIYCRTIATHPAADDSGCRCCRRARRACRQSSRSAQLLSDVNSSSDPSHLDVLLVRMTSDVLRPEADKYNYRNALRGLYILARDEQIKGLTKGIWPNTVSPNTRCCLGPHSALSMQARAILMNVSF